MPSCGDGACVPDEGENCMACPEDCGCPESLTCSWLGEDYGFQCFQDICGSELLETRCCDGDVLLVCDIGDGVLLSDCSLDGNICGWYPGSVDYPANYYCGPESVILPEDPSGTYPVECPVSSCIPQCAGKLCGDDGCGGVCGVCGTTNECVDGQCNQITCPSGELPDCVGECFDAAWVGDGYCDDGSWGAYFNCEYYAWDDGDCEPCTPECEGLECGLDPVCAFPCGECNEGASCIDGLCCVPQCEDKLCGADGCGGSCGECEDGLSCEDGLCVCQPDCAEKICGDDGCGGSCGTCGDGLSCMDDGCVPNFVDACDIDTGDACLGPTVKECVPDTAPEPMFGMFVVDCEKHGSTCGYVDAEWGYDCMGCGDLTTSPICDGDLRLHCDEAEDVQMWWNCKWDGANHTCVDGECVCVPACDGKECGDDGCSESCGSCSEGTICLGNDCILAGESCDTAIELNDGVPITEADDGLQLVVYGDTTEMANDLSGSCDDDTGQANDLVYIFTLDEIMDVGIAHDFDGSYHWPAVYIFAEECIVENEVACAEATSGAAVIEPLSLQPGTYFVVVDASYSSDASPFTLTIDFLIPATNETDCTNGQDDDLNGVTDCYDDNCITTDFCVMQNLPWYDDFGDDGDPVLGAFWYSEGNCGWEIAAMADENLAAEFGDAVGCSGVLPYWLASPILDVNACDEISVTMDQAALYTSWAVGHRLALFDGFINVAEIDLDIETLTTAFQTTGPFTFNVSGLDQVRVAAGYLGDDADTWRIDNLTIDCTAAALPNLYYTEYVEGSSLNKAVEIYNAGNAVVDLQNCAIDRYSNGAGYGESVEVPITPAEETLLLPNDVWVVCNAGFEYPSSCDYLTSDLNFNGDDAMALRCSEAVMDTFGMIGEDPGLYWANGDDSVQTKDMTLRRNCSVTQGDINGDDVFDPGAFWTVYSKDSFDDLGSYDCECEDGNCLLFEENLTDGITNTDLFTYSWTGECAGGGYDSEFGESVDSDGQPCLINKLFRHWTCSSAWTENTLATNDVIGEGNFFWTDYVVEVDVKGNTEDGCWPCDTVIHADMEFSITDGSNHVVYYEPQFNSEGVEEGCGCATHYHILNADKRHLWRFHFNSQQQEVSIYKDGLELGNSPMSLVSLNNRWSLRWWGEGHNFQTAYNGNVEFYIYKYIVYSSW